MHTYIQKIYIYIHTKIYINIHTYIHTHIRTYKNTCIHTYKYINTYIHTHTHIPAEEIEGVSGNKLHSVKVITF